MTLAKHSHGQFFFAVFALLSKFKFKLVSHHAANHFEDHLRKGLAKTDPLAATKWQETHWVSLCTTRSSRQGTAGIKSVRQELVWALPLLIVVVEAIDVDREDHIRSDRHASDLCVSRELHV